MGAEARLGNPVLDVERECGVQSRAAAADAQTGSVARCATQHRAGVGPRTVFDCRATGCAPARAVRTQPVRRLRSWLHARFPDDAWRGPAGALRCGIRSNAVQSAAARPSESRRATCRARTPQPG